jgi:hypothetical protein
MLLSEYDYDTSILYTRAFAGRYGTLSDFEFRAQCYFAFTFALETQSK